MTNEVNTWREALAEEARAAVAATPPPSGFTISFAQGGLKVRGEDVPGAKADFIILGFITEHDFYEGNFDSKNPAPPTCYAFGNGNIKDMHPHPDATNKQNGSCHGCPHLEWGTALQGAGKRCKQVVKLALIPATLDPKEIAEAEIGYAKLPVTSCKRWSGYVTKLAGQLQVPPFAVVTEISVTKENQSSVFMNLVEPIEDGAAIQAIMEKRKEVVLDKPYEAKAAAAPAEPIKNRFKRS